MQTHDIIEELEGAPVLGRNEFLSKATTFASRASLYDAQTRQRRSYRGFNASK